MSAPGDTRVIDVRAALERFDGNETILQEMIQLFQQHAPALRDAIRRALEARDSKAVALAAHNLRGVVVNFNAAAMAQAAKVVEQAADADNLTATRSALVRMESELARLLEALEKIKTARSLPVRNPAGPALDAKNAGLPRVG